jgi:two-component system cell cycle sensor histidine kinase PleC
LAVTRSHEGSGLGLSISKRHTEFHDGTLDIESEVGVGTIITNAFPAGKNRGFPREE